MKLFTKFLLLAVSLFSFTAINAQVKRALVIAIGEYAPGSKVPAIASVHDIKYIKNALEVQGFLPQNIDTLINAQATKKGMVAAIERLIENSNTNDIVVLHLSCHGQQIRDQKTIAEGKDEEDGYDEAFLGYDAEAKYSPGRYTGQNHLRDDELGALLKKLRARLGPKGNVLVTLDACHSGTGTRDESFAVTRGEPIPFPDPENPIEGVLNVKGIDNIGLEDVEDTTLASLVVFSASSPNQVNKQIFVNNEEVGSLSYSFYKALSGMSAGSSYDLLFQKIKNNIQSYIPDQIPMMEGNGAQAIFSGAFTGEGEHIYLQVGAPGKKVVSDSVFTIKKGAIDFMVVGIKCKVLLAGSKDIYTTAVIQKVESFRSIGVAAKPLLSSELYELVPEEENKGNMQASVVLQENGNEKITDKAGKDIKKFLTQTSMVNLASKGNYEVNVLESAGRGKVQMLNRNNKVIWESNLSSGNTLADKDKSAMIQVIKKDTRVRYLRTLEDGGALRKLMEVGLKVGDSVSQSGITVSSGDLYELQLKNTGDQNLYYTVLDIYPDDNTELLYPYNGKDPSDYFVQNGTTVNRKLKVSANSPKGVEILKIIVTKEPMDLRSIFENKPTRAESTPFTRFMDDVLNEKNKKTATRGDVGNIDPQQIGILTVNITVQ